MNGETLFKGIYLFADATKEDLASLVQIATLTKYAQGQIVFNEGDEANAMFVVEMGTVDIVPAGKELAVVTIGTGQAVGEVAFFARGKHPGFARAKEASRIYRIPFDRLDALLAAKPTLAMSIYRNASEFLAKHLRALLSDLDRRYF